MIKVLTRKIDWTAIVVTYDSQRIVKKCLASLGTNPQQQVIVVDNTDNNIGFAAGANKGAKKALGKYLLFINPDTIFKKDTISKTIKYIETQADVAVLGCKTLNTDGSLQFSCGHFPTLVNLLFDKIPVINRILPTHLIRKKDFYKKKQIVDWVSGAFMLVRKDVFNNLGGFDERYFMYVEDVDFCYRVKNAGYKVTYYPLGEITHLDEGKKPNRRVFKFINMLRGYMTFFSK